MSTRGLTDIPMGTRCTLVNPFAWVSSEQCRIDQGGKNVRTQ